jgi:hypothetical protein
VAELLRPGRAGSTTAADHVAVLDPALAQIPAALRARDGHGRVAVLVRTDAAGATKEFARHLERTGVQFSLGANLGHFDIPGALALLPAQTWTPAYQARKPRAARELAAVEARVWGARLLGCGDD